MLKTRYEFIIIVSGNNLKRRIINENRKTSDSFILFHSEQNVFQKVANLFVTILLLLHINCVTPWTMSMLKKYPIDLQIVMGIRNYVSGSAMEYKNELGPNLSQTFFA